MQVTRWTTGSDQEKTTEPKPFMYCGKYEVGSNSCFCTSLSWLVEAELCASKADHFVK